MQKNRIKRIFLLLIAISVFGIMSPTTSNVHADYSLYNEEEEIMSEDSKRLLRGNKVSLNSSEIRKMTKDEDRYSQEYVMALFKKTKKRDIESIAKKHDSEAIERFTKKTIKIGKGRLAALEVPSNQTVREFIEELNDDSDILIAEPAYKRKLSDWNPDDPKFTTNTDPEWQWQLQNIGTGRYSIEMPKAWGYMETELGSSYIGGSNSIVIAVLDTGYAFETRTDTITGWEYEPSPEAPDAANLWTNSDETDGDDDDDDANGYIDDRHGANVYDYHNTSPHSTEEGHPNDDYGHGTMVSNVIAAETDNATLGAGIAFNTKIMPVKIFDENGFTDISIIIDGIDYAIDNGADIINMSFGGDDYSVVEEAKINEAVYYGLTAVAASGNEGTSASQYPAAYSSVISVGASNQDGSRSSYSGYGTWLDLVAPVGPSSGGFFQQSYDCYFDPFGCIDGSNDPINGTDTFKVFDFDSAAGTSFATPQVSAVVGLLKSDPDNPQKYNEIKSLLRMTTTEVGHTGKTAEKGFGILDAYNVLSNSYNVRIPEDGDSRGNNDTGDWQSMRWKGECNADQYLTGISMTTSTKDIHEMLCLHKDDNIIGDPGEYTVYDFSHGDDRGSTISKDWDPYRYKGECAIDEFVTGISFYTSSLNPNSILCRQIDSTYSFDFKYNTRTVYGGDDRGTTVSRDWDYGHWKAECETDEMVVGVSRTTSSGHPYSVLCRRFVQSPDDHKVLFYNGHDNRLNTDSNDWAPQRWKSECDTSSFAKGASMSTSNKQPNAILCKDAGTTITEDPQDFTAYKYYGGDNRGTTSTGDWDFGRWKGECAEDEIITGLSMIPSKKYPYSIICQKFDTSAITIESGYSVYTYNGGNDRGSTTTGNWDQGFWKGECAENEIMTGVSMNPSSKTPHSILCREYTQAPI